MHLYPFSSNYFNPENSIFLTLPLFPLCFFPLLCLYFNFWLQASFWYKYLYPYSLTWIHMQLQIHIWMEFFRNKKFTFFHKRNLNPKVKLFLIKLSADISSYFQAFQQVIVLYVLTNFEMYIYAFLTYVISYIVSFPF